MELLENILAKFCKDHGYEGSLTDDEVRALAYRHFDSDLSEFVHGVWVEGNILVIQCTEPVAVQEFQIRAEGLRQRINRDAGRAALTSIRLTLYKTKRVKQE
jgi:hypothetical protein